MNDNVSINKVISKKAGQVILSPTKELNIIGLEEHLPELLEGRVVTKDDTIQFNLMGDKIGFLVTTTTPIDGPVIVDSGTEFIIGQIPKSVVQGVPRVNYEDKIKSVDGFSWNVFLG